MKLSSENVENIFVSCLFDNGSDTSKAIIVEGITAKFGFDPIKIESNKEDISTMLQELPNEFKQNGGGGMTFLNACNDRNGNQWTGLHDIMEKLFCLGMAIDKVKPLMPRDLWKMLPGGMPYYVVLE